MRNTPHTEHATHHAQNTSKIRAALTNDNFTKMPQGIREVRGEGVGIGKLGVRAAAMRSADW